MIGNAAELGRGMIAMAGGFAAWSRWTAARALLLAVAAAALDGAGILLLVPVLGVVVGTGHGEVAAFLAARGVTTLHGQLTLLVATFLAVSLLRAGSAFARDVALSRLQAGFIEHERNRLLERLADAPWSRLAQISHARVASLLSQELGRVGSSLQMMLQTSVALLMLAVQGMIAFFLAPWLAALAAAGLIGVTIVFLASQQRVRLLGNEMVNSGQAMLARAATLLSGLKAAAAQDARPLFLAEQRSIQARARAVTVAFAHRQAGARLAGAIGSAVLASVIVVLGFSWLEVPAATLITVLIVFARMSGPLLLVYQSIQTMAFHLPSFETVRRFEAELGAIGPAAEDPVPPPPGSLDLSGVTFLHPGGGGVCDVTLSIAPGCFVGIAGPSGAGKTTLVDLIVGLFDPQSGSISMGGVPLDAARRRGLASQTAYVPQDGFLFHDTVRRNLTWSSRDAADEAIAAALERVGAVALVARLPQGLETVIGERGGLLSGGERQRLGLARALLARPRLLVLDEAANAIDAASEAELLTGLASMPDRPTILMVTHREDSLAWCDLVLRVDEGRVQVTERPTAQAARSS